MKVLKAFKKFDKLLVFSVVLLLFANTAYAQPAVPQRTITVAATQAIHFGTLSVTGSGGTATVGWDGSRTSTGGVILLAMAPYAQPAIFEIKLCHGRNVILTYDATTTLTGSNGGSFILDIGPTEKGINGVSFTTNHDCNFITPLRVGGTLHVPGGAISGVYSGSFAITFNQE